MAHQKKITGWKLDRGQRERLLQRFPPSYRNVVADHVTLAVGEAAGDFPGQVDAKIVGQADDEDSLECLVVSIDGSTARPDGSTFHITWSLDGSKGRKARESNQLLKDRGWKPLEEAIPVMLHPARL